MKIIALANQKGGVAKTSCCYNLAVAKALSGYNVLMVDLDPQASLTISCGIEPGTHEKDICDLFTSRNINPASCAYTIEATELDNLYLIPSDIDLAEVEMNLFSRRGRENILKKSLVKLEDYFDYVFIDCPPQLATLTTNALVAADSVIIPVKTDYLSYRGLRALLETIQDIKEDLNADLQIDGIIATFFESRVNDQKDVLELLKQKADVIGIIKKSADVPRKVIDGIPIVLWKPKSDVAIEYKNIAGKI